MTVQRQDELLEGARDPDGIEIRRMHSAAEYAACVAIQQETWGADFTECVPATILRVAQYIGGVSAGAFTPASELLGFVFGMTGVRDGRLVHWSDMLAVRASARDRGLGRRLKLHQRELVRALGVETMYWTFDPLVARNAHLNLTRLGARVDDYATDLYGEQLGGVLHRGLGTDRFIVRWDLRVDDGVGPRAAPRDGSNASAVRGAETRRSANGVATVTRVSLSDGDHELRDAVTVQVEIPHDLDAVVAADANVARRWREMTRRAFTWYLARGYDVVGFESDHAGARPHYTLRRSPRQAGPA